jgi:hypothetical protein
MATRMPCSTMLPSSIGCGMEAVVTEACLRRWCLWRCEDGIVGVGIVVATILRKTGYKKETRIYEPALG